LTTIQGKVISSVQSVPGFGDLVANFNKSLVSIDAINIKASLESLKSARLPELTVKFRIFGKANDISLKNVGLSGTFVSDIVKKVADEVVKQAGNLAAQFAKAMAEVIGKYTGQIAEEAGKVADEVVQAAEQSAKVVTEAVSSITNFSRDAGKKIVDFGQSALSGAGSVAGAIGSGIKKLKFW
jgi:methyl-accepting chemotaxis protein